MYLGLHFPGEWTDQATEGDSFYQTASKIGRELKLQELKANFELWLEQHHIQKTPDEIDEIIRRTTPTILDYLDPY